MPPAHPFMSFVLRKVVASNPPDYQPTRRRALYVGEIKPNDRLVSVAYGCYGPEADTAGSTIGHLHLIICRVARHLHKNCRISTAINSQAHCLSETLESHIRFSAYETSTMVRNASGAARYAAAMQSVCALTASASLCLTASVVRSAKASTQSSDVLSSVGSHPLSKPMVGQGCFHRKAPTECRDKSVVRNCGIHQAINTLPKP
jgi:hypothetical protein